MTAAPDLDALSRHALAAAREAAVLALEGFRGVHRVREKGRADLVTEHDVAAERALRASLARLTPEIPVIGEEEGGTGAGDAGLTWVCDPIDGTTNFVHGHPFFAVSVGLVRGEEALAGAVVAPALAIEWRGAAGVGAFRNDEACGVSATAELSEALLATGFHPISRQLDGPGNNLGAFERILPRVRGIRRCGAAAVDLCLVADGTYDAYWERHLSLWDTAAGASIALAGGARVTDLAGAAPNLAIGHLAVSNGRLHPALLSLLAPDAAPIHVENPRVGG